MSFSASAAQRNRLLSPHSPTCSGSNLGPWPILLGPSAALAAQPPAPSPPGGIGSLPSVSCVFVSGPAARGNLSCDGYESFLGEGEVASPYIVSWSHSSVGVWMPAGIGARAVSVLPGGQPPASGVYPNFRYDDPLVQSTAVVGQSAEALAGGFYENAINADGGTLLQVQGWFLPRPYSGAVGFPQPLPLAADTIEPMQAVVVRWGATCLYDPAGPSVLPPSPCRNLLAYVTSARADDRLTFQVPPGLGANRSLVIEVWDAGAVVASSQALYLAYEPPTITSLSPSTVLVTDYQSGGLTATTISVRGKNIGRESNGSFWEPLQDALTVAVSGVPAGSPGRGLVGGVDSIVFVLPYAPVGNCNVSVTVAGQTGTLSASSPDALLVACRCAV